jgi:DUF2914 family protein
MKDNKVVIKLNYPQHRVESKSPQLVTVWHVQRIITVTILMILIVALLVYLFLRKEHTTSVDKQNIPTVTDNVAKSVPPLVKPSVKKEVKQTAKDIEPTPQIKIKETKIITPKINKEKIINLPELKKVSETRDRPKASDHILDSRISRALLAKDIVNKEPVGEVTGKVTVVKEKATGVFFFTEIHDMKGKALYHEWLRNGELVFKRKINILNSPWRAATSKLITYSRKGSWQVRLVDQNGVVLSVVSFDVI